MEKQRAVIDADFFIKFTEKVSDGTLFIKVMDDLGIEPVMHEYVAYTELKGNITLQRLIADKKVRVLKYVDYINEANRDDYGKYFEEAYEIMNHYEFTGSDIYVYDDKDENLGEIRSLYMAKSLRYPYFMSDDSGAKHFAKNYFTSKSRVEVRNVYDALVMCKKEGTNLTWREINSTATEALRKKQDKLTEIKALYAK